MSRLKMILKGDKISQEVNSNGFMVNSIMAGEKELARITTTAREVPEGLQVTINCSYKGDKYPFKKVFII